MTTTTSQPLRKDGSLTSVGTLFQVTKLFNAMKVPESLLLGVVVPSLSCVWLFETPWTTEHQASLSFTVSQSLLKLMSIYSVMTSNNLILCHPLFSCYRSFPAAGSFPMSRLHIRWPNYWSFSISPSREHSGLISFRIDWLGLPAVQGTLTSLLQHHSSKASILPCSAFFMVQFSHLYMTAGKSTALTIQSLTIQRYLCFVIRCLGKVN